MIGQMTGQMRPAPKNSSEQAVNERSVRRHNEILVAIDGLHALSRRGLWRLLLFVAASAAALWLNDSALFAALPGPLGEILGDPPPVALIHGVLVVSSVSGLILIAGRVTGDARPCPSWLQFGMSTVFYLLYASSNELNQFFPLVFFAGLTLLFLEYLAIAVQTSRVIQEEREQLGRMLQ